MQIRRTNCCGVREIAGLHGSSQKAKLLYVYRNTMLLHSSYRAAHLVFYDSTAHDNGRKFANYIKRNKLGTVIESGAVKNPNSPFEVKVWVWTPNRPNFIKWYKKNKT